jgi:outer membrane protein assembly factor BamB
MQRIIAHLEMPPSLDTRRHFGRRLFGLAFLPLLASAQTSILTYHNDLFRTGQNLTETTLTPGNVSSAQFGMLFRTPVDGYVYAQPLYVPNLAIHGKSARDTVFVATEHDTVYALDAHSGRQLWRTSFLDPARNITPVPAALTNCGSIAPELGITATPVIDPGTGTMYVVAMTLENGQEIVHRLHALDISTGRERKGSPVEIQATYPGTDSRGNRLWFDPKLYKERAGLALWNGVVYTSWSSHCDTGDFHGWILGYDTQTLNQVAVFNSTPGGIGGAFWASGAAPAIDSDGNMYVFSGNGTFTAAHNGSDYSDSLLKLSTSRGLALAGFFAPYNVNYLGDFDVDLGSSGALLLPDSAGTPEHPHLLLSAGKEGRLYLLDRDNPGGVQTGADTSAVQTSPNMIGPLFGIPAFFNGSVYFCAMNDSLKAFPVQNGVLLPVPVTQTNISFGFPGAVPSISANGTANGIVWIVDDHANLRAYAADDLLHPLLERALGSYVKFSTPSIADGRVFVGTQGSLVAFGLLERRRLEF